MLFQNYFQPACLGVSKYKASWLIWQTDINFPLKKSGFSHVSTKKSGSLQYTSEQILTGEIKMLQTHTQFFFFFQSCCLEGFLKQSLSSCYNKQPHTAKKKHLKK